MGPGILNIIYLYIYKKNIISNNVSWYNISATFKNIMIWYRPVYCTYDMYSCKALLMSVRCQTVTSSNASNACNANISVSILYKYII